MTRERPFSKPHMPLTSIAPKIVKTKYVGFSDDLKTCDSIEDSLRSFDALEKRVANLKRQKKL